MSVMTWLRQLSGLFVGNRLLHHAIPLAEPSSARQRLYTNWHPFFVL
jgi:hypothetical protein